MRAFLLLASIMFVGSAFAEQSQLDEVIPCPSPKPDTYRILFIGDSITRHAVNDFTINEMGWSHVSGMAASSDKTDYPGVLSRMISDDRGVEVVRCYHTYAGGGSIPGRIKGFGKVADAQADLVVIQLGEHDDATTDTRLFRFEYAKLLELAKGMSSKPKVVAIGPWFPSAIVSNGVYPKEVAKIDLEMKSIAALKRVPYRSVADIGATPGTQGTGLSQGVMWHPNDYGHSLYAKKIFDMYKQN